MGGATLLRWLFVDMNSYFASVEQQLRPELRGRPIAVAAMEVESTSCIAASYEAKAFGVKTGTLVAQARHMCPGLLVVGARPQEYVAMHHRIVAVVEDHLHVEKVLSIDEMACRLPSNENSSERVREIALGIKASLKRELGECIRCSIGIAPNRFLAKVASDMQKPDGLVVLEEEDLPGRIMHLETRDLPGVGRSMFVRLAVHGGDTMQALWGMSAEELARAFGGSVGRQFWRNLHGEEVEERGTTRGSINHSSVLSPERRNDEGAFGMLVRLVHKGAARLRDMHYAAGQMGVNIQYEDHTQWHAHVGIEDAQDTQTLIEAMEFLWKRRPAGRGTLRKVGMVLFDFEWEQNVTLPLFGGDTKRAELARAMDHINARFGRQRVYFGEMHETRKAAPMRIAFNSVPDEAW